MIYISAFVDINLTYCPKAFIDKQTTQGEILLLLWQEARNLILCVIGLHTSSYWMACRQRCGERDAMTHMVNIEGISPAEVLARLFNNSRPVGMGILAAIHGPQELSVEMAQELLDEEKRRGGNISFDYLFGRPLKVFFSNDRELDPRLYDRDNGGPGTAAQLINELRKAKGLT